jgi:3-hydroxybutyryl-CoA dehydrogenase
MEVHTIAVIGAGPRGRGITLLAALGGYRTILEDLSHTALEQSLAWIQSALAVEVSPGEIQAPARDAALANIRTASTVDGAIRDADLVIEAVAEEMEMKIELFTLFDKFAKPGAIFASSTSSLSITEMAAMTFCPERCLGMRFFDPVPKTKLLKLSKARHTSEETVAACRQVARRMGKQVVVVGPFEPGHPVGPQSRLAVPEPCVQVAPPERKRGRRGAHDYLLQKTAGAQD